MTIPREPSSWRENDTCTQAFRLGECVWGVQFHPEVTLGQIHSWIDERDEAPIDYEAIRGQTPERIEAWHELGRNLCGAFVDVAERVATPA